MVPMSFISLFHSDQSVNMVFEQMYGAKSVLVD